MRRNAGSNPSDGVAAGVLGVAASEAPAVPRHVADGAERPADAPARDPGVRRAPPTDLGHRIVVVGGGAGGLELAARLGDQRAPGLPLHITLVDALPTHVWKPQLHELASGTLHGAEQEVDFVQQARRHGFHFQLGRLAGLDRGRREVLLDALDEDGTEIAPRRTVPYDTLVLAVGSVVNDFGTPGVAAHALTLDDASDARRFHRRLLAACARAELQADGPVDIVIVGGGATGVELAAELSEAVPEIATCGPHLSAMPAPVRLHIVEGGNRLVGALPPELSHAVRDDLEAAGVDLRFGRRVTAVEPDAVVLDSGARLRSTLTVWAAGVRGPDVLQALDGLELNRTGQLVVRPTLQTSRDDDVFAMGDCASLLPPGATTPVPPRAQTAHQQAAMLAPALAHRLRGRPLPAFHFDDKGTFVSLGRRNAVGRVVACLPRGGFSVQGCVARWTYRALQRQHAVTLHGVLSTVLATAGSWLTRRTQPRVKLH